MAKSKPCFHCEPNAAKRVWLSPADPCPPCRSVRERDPHDLLPSYDPETVRARLGSLLKWKATGIERESHVQGLIEIADLEVAITQMGVAHVLKPLEVRVLRARLIQGRSAAKVAYHAGCTPETLDAAEKSAIKKLTCWLCGLRTPVDMLLAERPDEDDEAAAYESEADGE